MFVRAGAEDVYFRTLGAGPRGVDIDLPTTPTTTDRARARAARNRARPTSLDLELLPAGCADASSPHARALHEPSSPAPAGDEVTGAVLLDRFRHPVAAPRAVLVTGPGFDDHDVIYCYYRLEEEGYDVDVATPEAMRVVGRYGVPLPLDTTAKPNMPIAALSGQAYDALILSGGHEAEPGRDGDRAVLELVAAMDAAGKVVAGLGRAPWIMVRRQTTSGGGARDGHPAARSYYGSVRLVMRSLLDAVGWRAGRPLRALA